MQGGRRLGHLRIVQWKKSLVNGGRQFVLNEGLALAWAGRVKDLEGGGGIVWS